MEKSLTIALVGTPNSGKTTLFNLLTKSGEAVGNRAGVTFSAKKEPLRKFSNLGRAEIIDLPGIYSLSHGSNEEKAALHALKTEKIDVILNIVDATNLERGLFLTLSLMSLEIPIVLALGMMDEAEKEELMIDIAALEKALQLPVFPISAAKNRGIPEMIRGCFSPKKIPVPYPHANHAERAEWIQKLLAQAIKEKGKENVLSDKIDNVICRPFIGIPLFFAVMCFVFFLTFSSLGGGISSWMEALFENISLYIQAFLRLHNVSEWLCRFLTDGIWMGVASVLTFIPQTAILFFLLAALEDSGYLARAALVMDDLMRPFGLSGKAIIPILIGFGCTVPAVMATATLDSREKETTIASLPFIPCSARLPVIVLIVSAFFEEHASLFAIGLYFLCLAVTLVSAILFRKRNSENDAPLLVIELPKYRLPRPVSLFREVRNKLHDFLVRAGTVVFLSCVVVDLLAMLTPNLTPAAESGESILAVIGDLIAPMFAPLGFDDGRLVAALAAGFFAKEAIVSTAQILIPEGLPAILSTAGAVSFAVFSLLYVPCAATLAAVRRELGTKKALQILLRTGVFAFIIAFLVYTGASLCIKQKIFC